MELATRNPTTGVTTLGKVIGPDGKPFFRVDAPHGAPSQHCFQYDTVMLVDALSLTLSLTLALTLALALTLTRSCSSARASG